ncbi:hypothetical protein DOA20_21015 [Salmonella enterica subsp. enterica serovar Newport]|nr:hypothetical protein [Salmonella enterica subsp. enterica serovar Newport]
MKKITRWQFTARAKEPYERTSLAPQIALWVYRQNRPVTTAEIAAHFNLSVHAARRLIHAIMRRADGTRCSRSLEMYSTLNAETGQKRPVKYFTVHDLLGEENMPD